MNPADVTTEVLNAAPVADISLIALFLQAHLVVKLVMIGLVIASIWCWAIIVDKFILVARTRKIMDRFE
jgi:biopolymer transport protein TolQ